MIFYNDQAEQYFNQTYEELQDIFIKPIDSVALMNLSNHLQSDTGFTRKN